MGNQCVRLCSRPCKTKLSVEQRIESIYINAPFKVTESYCLIKATQLWNYLKDRPLKIPQCVNVLKSIIFGASSQMTEKYSVVSLLMIRFLAEQTMEFLNLAYLAVYQIIKLPFFSSIKLKVYDSLKSLSNLYPNEELGVLEDIINEILSYIVQPENITKDEIEFFHNILIVKYSNLPENNSINWKKILGIILNRIMCLVEIQQELQLLADYSEKIFGSGLPHKDFFIFILEYLYKIRGWGEKSSEIFEAVVVKNSKFMQVQGPILLELFLNYLKNHKYEYIEQVAQSILILLENCKNIETFKFSEKLEKFLIKLEKTNKNLPEQIFYAWSQNAEIQSFFLSYKNFLNFFQKSQQVDNFISICRGRVESELNKKKVSMTFMQRLMDLLYESIILLENNFDSTVLKVRVNQNLAFLVEKTADFIVFNKSEIKALFSVFINSVETQDSLANYKSFMKIFILIINQRIPEHKQLIFSLIMKIRSQSGSTIPFYTSILLWALLKILSQVHQIHDLENYLNSSIDHNLKTEPYRSNILNAKQFNSISSLKKSIFSKHSSCPCSFSSSLFNFDAYISQVFSIIDSESDQDDDFLPYNRSETEFSVSSSIHERVQEAQEKRMSLLGMEYEEILIKQEELDRKMLFEISGNQDIYNH